MPRAIYRAIRAVEQEVIRAVEQEAIRAGRRDLLPDIETAYWLLHHVCEELDPTIDSERGSQRDEKPEENHTSLA